MVDKPTPFEALQLAIAKAGSQAEIARIAEVSTTAVWKWVQSSKRVPAEFVLKIEAATGVSRHDLRPDIYPLEAHGREVMTDRHVGTRFTGVDRFAGSPVARSA
jgi:DNA-binding transcriptional regulator YdaS (Cro superfamily)